jgi:hypothetical protein
MLEATRLRGEPFNLQRARLKALWERHAKPPVVGTHSSHLWINCIVPDSRGFLWLCTPEGLARFDGYQFLSYGVDQGLPDPRVNTFIETRDGRLLVGTPAGLAVFKHRADERTHSRFDLYTLGPRPEDRSVSALFEDRTGVLWCGIGHALYRVHWTGSSPRFEKVVEDGSIAIVGLAQDGEGNLWAAANAGGRLEVTRAGEIRRYGEEEGLPFVVNQEFLCALPRRTPVSGEAVRGPVGHCRHCHQTNRRSSSRGNHAPLSSRPFVTIAAT